MVVLVEQKSYASVVETPEEQLMTDTELKSRALEYLKSLHGKVFFNKVRDIPIVINKDIRNELMTKIHVNPKKRRPVARTKFMAIKLLPYLLRDSDPDSLDEPDYKGRKDIEKSNVFKYECHINYIRYRVFIRTVKVKNKNDSLYYLKLEQIELTEK
jgi:hypothetical protein